MLKSGAHLVELVVFFVLVGVMQHDDHLIINFEIEMRSPNYKKQPLSEHTSTTKLYHNLSNCSLKENFLTGPGLHIP